MRLYFPSRTNSSVLLTNSLTALPISGNILANGGVIGQGLPFRINLGATGVATNFFAQGFYAITNNLLNNGGIVINVYDNGTQLYDYTNLLWSGYNTYASIFGSNLPPSFDAITNAVGNYYATSNALFVASNYLNAQITAATNNGITAAQATNISKQQALIATNDLNTVLRTLIATKAPTNSPTLYNATNVGHLGTGELNVTNDATIGGSLNVVGIVSDGSIVTSDYIAAQSYYGDGSHLTNLPVAALTNLATMGYSNASAFVPFVTNIASGVGTVVSNGLSGRLIDTNTALVTRLIATNDALEAKLQRGSILLTNLAITNVVAGSNATVFIQTNTAVVSAEVSRQAVTNIVNAIAGPSAGGIVTNAGTGINNAFTNPIIHNGKLSTHLNGNANYGLTNAQKVTFSGGVFLETVNGGNTGGGGVRNDLIGGSANTMLGSANTLDNLIIGGRGNMFNDQWTTPGLANVLLGGTSNSIQNSALRGYSNSIILGGFSNTIASVSGAVVGGTRGSVSHDGVLAFSDTQNSPWASAIANSAIFRYQNGVGINTNNPGSAALRVAGNTETTGDLAAGTSLTIGSNTVFTVTTDNIAISGAGSAFANGTYQKVSSVKWTNNFGAILTNITGNYSILSNTVTLYTSTGTPYGTGWILSSGGANPTPAGSAGNIFNLNGNTFRGWINSTNLDQRLADLTNGNFPTIGTVNSIVVAARSTNVIEQVSGTTPFAQTIYPNTNGALARALSNSIAADLVRAHPSVNGLMISNSASMTAGTHLRGDGRSTVLLDQIHRGTSDSGGFSGPALVLNDHVSVSDVAFLGVPTVNNQQNTPPIGTIFFDGNLTPHGFWLSRLYDTNTTTGLYLRATNTAAGGASGVTADSQFLTSKSGLFVAGGLHDLTYFGNIFSAIGPDTISGDSGEFGAQGARIFSGTNRFIGNIFRGFNPKHGATAGQTTNATALEVTFQEAGGISSNQPPRVYLIGSLLESGNTNVGGSTPYDIMNGFYSPFGEPGYIYAAGSWFDRAKVYGPVMEMYLPVTGGVNVTDTAAFLVCTAPGNADLETVWIRTNTAPLGYTNVNRYYIAGTPGSWTLFDEFDTPVSTSTGAGVTNKNWTDTGGSPVTFRNKLIGETNDYNVTGTMVASGALSAGSFTNRDAALAGKIPYRDANGKEIPVTVGSGLAFSSGTLSASGGGDTLWGLDAFDQTTNTTRSTVFIEATNNLTGLYIVAATNIFEGGLGVGGGLVVGGRINDVKVYRALLTQSGTDAPTATVLENSFGGTIVWTRDSVGRYIGTLSGAFSANKTFARGVSSTVDGVSIKTVTLTRTSANAVSLSSASTEAVDFADDLLTDTPIEILVYP